MKQTSLLMSLPLLLVHGCGGTEQDSAPSKSAPAAGAAAKADAADHAHAEESLGSITIGEHSLELAQGHGAVAAGKEAHLVVKLPYSDSGSTVVRAWIGSEDRTLSYVGKGQYAPSHDDYDIHATAPDPLPANSLWWIEITKPDGIKLVGSVKPILE